MYTCLSVRRCSPLLTLSSMRGGGHFLSSPESLVPTPGGTQRGVVEKTSYQIFHDPMAPLSPEPILGLEINLWVAVSFNSPSPEGTLRQVGGGTMGRMRGFVNVQYPLEMSIPEHMSGRGGSCRWKLGVVRMPYRWSLMSGMRRGHLERQKGPPSQRWEAWQSLGRGATLQTTLSTAQHVSLRGGHQGRVTLRCPLISVLHQLYDSATSPSLSFPICKVTMGHVTSLISQQPNHMPPAGAGVGNQPRPCPREARSLVGEAWRESPPEAEGPMPTLRDSMCPGDSEPPGEASILSTFF